MGFLLIKLNYKLKLVISIPDYFICRGLVLLHFYVIFQSSGFRIVNLYRIKGRQIFIQNFMAQIWHWPFKELKIKIFTDRNKMVSYWIALHAHNDHFMPNKNNGRGVRFVYFSGLQGNKRKRRKHIRNSFCPV